LTVVIASEKDKQFEGSGTGITFRTKSTLGTDCRSIEAIKPAALE
jgi:hypothetical protein